MTKYEWDYPPTMRQRRGSANTPTGVNAGRSRIETVEILPPQQPERTVRLDIHHHVNHRRRQQIPPWLSWCLSSWR